MQQISTLQPLVPESQRPSWFAGIYRRVVWAVRAFKAPSLSPVVALGNGMLFDPSRNILIIEGDCQIHSTGTMRISASKHLIFQSGQDSENDRPGYLNSIWFNPDFDDKDRPINWDAGVESGERL